jgi:hypothetical protein
MKSVFHDCKVTVLSAEVADAASVTFRGVDMAADDGYEGVAFVFGVVDGSVVADFVPSVQQDTASNFATAADLAGSANTFASITGVKTVVTDIFRPTERYVRPVLVVPNTAATCVVCCTAIQYKGRSAPATQDSTTTGSWTGEFHSSPAEGTA